jgi:hypothetical protein
VEDVVAARRGVATFGGYERRNRTFLDSLQDFVHRYGWRAYALPILAVITVLALATTGGGQAPTEAAAGPAQSPSAGAQFAPNDINLKSDAPGAGSQDTALPADALPSGGDYTIQGTGAFRTLLGTGPVVGQGTVHHYRIDVEQGITGIDLRQFAQRVQTVLADKRSWAGHQGLALQRVDSGPVDFAISLTSSYTVRKLCGYDIHTETSCFAPSGSVAGLTVSRVVLNNARWVRGDAAYVGDLDAYRTYMINHEAGHALGHMHSHECLSDGLAPVMMQQTLGLKSKATGQMCSANPWPYPPGVTDAPGAEQPDTQSNSTTMN